MNLTILYRGSLISCNYGCEYCPFAKRSQPASELAQDCQEVQHFTQWIKTQTNHQFSILFTPWGEALIHPWYQQALIQLSHLPNVKKVAIQTNLSCQLHWITQSNQKNLALWCTFHPQWVSRKQFLSQCLKLDQTGIRFSVGIVGFPHFKTEIAALRQELPPHIYLWINAVKKDLPHLSLEDRHFFESIDPLYPINTHHYPSFGKSCRTGTSVFSVDGKGTMRRCHFIQTPIGNIYDPNFQTALFERPCTNQTCHCHIGYVHLDQLKLDQTFGNGLLERIPNYLDSNDKKESDSEAGKC